MPVWSQHSALDRMSCSFEFAPLYIRCLHLQVKFCETYWCWLTSRGDNITQSSWPLSWTNTAPIACLWSSTDVGGGSLNSNPRPLTTFLHRGQWLASAGCGTYLM